jgi:hypothetical protein
MYQAILGTKLIVDLNYVITIADYVSIPVENNIFFFLISRAVQMSDGRRRQ